MLAVTDFIDIHRSFNINLSQLSFHALISAFYYMYVYLEATASQNQSI